MATFKHYLDLGILGEDVDCVIEYDYQPPERQTMNYPGCDAEVDITGVSIDGISFAKPVLDMLIGELNCDDSLIAEIIEYEAGKYHDGMADVPEY